MSWQVKRDIRRQFGIMAYVGANGSGKSLTAVLDTLPSLEEGRKVVSTVRLLDYENPRPCDDPFCDFPSHPNHGASHPLWIPLRSFSELLEVEHCDVLLDEVTGVCSSRESLSLPGAVANLLVQLRRRDVVLRWTSPAYMRADTILRECTQAVTLCRGLFPRRVSGRAWASYRFISSKVVDARQFDTVSVAGVSMRSGIARSCFRLSTCPAINAYDTLDTVLSLPVIESGRCVSCGGRRAVPRCDCDDKTPLTLVSAKRAS